MALHIIHRKPDTIQHPNPIVFIHGMWQGSWVWEEYFLDFFLNHGFECYCLNLRGHHGSPANGWFRFVTIGNYVQDLTSLINNLDNPPILLGHSMGGFIVQKYLENHDVPLAILMAPVPPRGLWKPTLRVMLKMPLSFLLGNLTLNLRYIVNNVSKARQMFFGPEMEEERIQMYVDLMQNESYAAYLGMLLFSLVRPSKVSKSTRIELIGASNDWAIPPELIWKTAEAYALEPKFFEGRHHNLMLESGWEEVASHCLKLMTETTQD